MYAERTEAEVSLKASVEKACQPTYVPFIVEGRAEVLGMPRAWLLENIEWIADDALHLADYWEYRRLLELYEVLDARGPINSLIARGLLSTDEDVREAAEDWRDQLV